MSVGGSEYNPAELTEKIKHTRDFKKKGSMLNPTGFGIFVNNSSNVANGA
jgi:hypothetical protein